MKHTKLFLFFISLSLLAGNVTAQKSTPVLGIIKGKLINEKTGEPIPYATIKAGKFPSYADIVKVTTTDDKGIFELKVTPAIYILSISSVGYQTIPMSRPAQIKKTDEVADLGIIKMKEEVTNIAEVIVKPLVSVTSSEIVYNLDQDPDRETSTLYDLIDRVPMVERLPNGKIYIGNPDVKFLIVRNGKKDILFDDEEMKDEMLKSLPAKAFSKVRIELLPSERYGKYTYVMSIDTDPTSRMVGVINMNNEEYNFSNGNLKLSSGILGSQDKLRFRAAMGFGNAHSPQSVTNLEQHFFANDSWLRQQEKSYTTGQSYLPSIGLSYDLGKQQFLTARMSFSDSRQRNKRTIDNRQAENGIDKIYSLYSISRNYRQSYDGEVNYEYDFKKPKRVLNIVYNFTQAPDHQETDIQAEGDYDGISIPLLDGRSRTSQHTVQAHYSEPFSSIWTLETGMNYLYRDYRTYSDYTENGALLPEKMNNMESSKHIVNNYLNLRFTSNNVSAKLDLRSEYLYDGDGTKIQQGDNVPELISEKGFIIIPSLSISTKLGKKSFVSRITTSYSWNRKRPNLKTMSTHVDNSNPNNIYVGNPTLTPEDIHNLSVSFGTKNNISLSLSGSISDNKIVSDWYSDEKGRVINTYANAGIYRSINAILHYTFNIKKMRFNLMGSEIYSYRKSIEKVTNAYNTILSLSANIPVYKTLNFYSTLGYMDIKSSGMEGMKVDPVSLSIAANFKLFKQRLEVDASINNILRLRNSFGHELYTADFTQQTNRQTNVIPVKISLSWRLGTFKVKAVRTATKGAIIDDVLKEE